MGVRGLKTYLADTTKNPQFVKCGQDMELVGPWKDINPGLVIDGCGLIHHILHEFDLHIIIARNGGAYELFEQSAETWLRRLLDVGLELVVIFDGAGEPQKHETHRSRDADQANKACAVLQAMEMGVLPTKEDAKPRVNVGIYVACMAHVCRQLKIEFWCCTGEADCQIATVTLKRQFLACLANDSDFFCLQAPYIPLDSLKLVDSKLKCSLYTPESISKSLGVHPSMLPHIACLCGNDYIDYDNDRPALHQLLNIPSSGAKTTFEAIGCVVAFLANTSADHLRATLDAHAAHPLVVKYQQALLQYDVTMPQNHTEHKDSFVRIAQAKGQVFGFALKLLGCLLNNEAVFRPSLGASTFMLHANMTNMQQIQFYALSAFSRIRARICDAVLGPGMTVEEEINAADGLIVYRRVTYALPPKVANGMPLFLWMIGEQDLTPDTVKSLGQTYGPELQFTMLALRALTRVEHLTQHEKCAILGHVISTKQCDPSLSVHVVTNPGQATTTPPGGPSISSASSTAQRSYHVVAMYEQCLSLCASANIASACPIVNPFEQPSHLFDGVRLTLALEGKPNSVPTALLKQVDEGKQVCRFEESCRWVNCPLPHPPNVWGLCTFDGKCTKEDCVKRHLKQHGPLAQSAILCRFDGNCTRKTCNNKHVLQTKPASPASPPLCPNKHVLREKLKPMCRYGPHCRRADCVFQH